MKKMIELTLPEFAFVEGYRKDQDDELFGRNVILHTRSASVMEVFDAGDALFKEDVVTYSFKRYNHLMESMTGEEYEERFVMALHYSPLLDLESDRLYIVNAIMKPAAMWYCDYCTFMDNNVMEEDL